ncbi:MAG: O-antigen ligase family protein [Caldilineaceae bacterium]|nr:O-antigen ligase family protein [Caldilineaceae bacterium]
MNARTLSLQSHRLFLLTALLAMAAALAGLPLEQAGVLMIAFGGGLILLRWPWLAWPLLGAALPFAAAGEIGRISLADALLAGALLLWLADGARRKTLVITPSWPLTGALIWILAQSLSLLGAVDLVEGGAEVVKWVEFAAVLAVIPGMLTDRQRRWLIAGLLIGGCGQALWGLYQFSYRIGPDWFIILGRFMRASGSFGQPNPYGGYLGLCLPVAVSLTIWAWGQVSRPNAATPDATTDQPLRQRLTALLPALGYSAASALIGAGLLASWSRGAWLGALAGIGITLIFRSRTAFFISLAAGVALIMALLLGSFRPGLMPAPVAERLADIPAYLGLTDVLSQPVTDENFSVIERVAHWVAALRMWEQAPWLGVGPGNYARIYPAVRLPLWEEALGHAHNVYLNTLAETGVIGLAAYLLLWGGAMIWLIRMMRQAGERSYRAALTLGVLGVVAHLSVHNLFDNLFVQGMTLHLALLLAAVTPRPDKKIA